MRKKSCAELTLVAFVFSLIASLCAPGSAVFAFPSDGELSGPSKQGVSTSKSFESSDVGKWGRFVVTLPNSSYSGNPFELEVDCTFVHVSDGRTITLPGYYAGGNLWKIAFMPNRTGFWTYTTSSSDPDLDNVSGTLRCVASEHPGMLKLCEENFRKWKFTDGPFVIPIGLRMEVFCESGSDPTFLNAVNFMKTNNLHLMETRLTEESTQFETGRHDFIFLGDWWNHQFDLANWDRMEDRLDVLTENGLGAHIMFYSDDAGKPGWGGWSDTENLVIRYAVARFAAYPIIWFNTGLDIAEYRTQEWVDWFGTQIRSLDPYGHPISSRYGGGSGEYVMSGQFFDSRGDRTALINDMRNFYDIASEPVSMDDAWGENRPSHPFKDFRPEDIRRAFWKCVVTGGLGGLVRGYDGYFHFDTVETDLESEQWLKMVNPFIQDKFRYSFCGMLPDQALVTNGNCLANPERTMITCFLMGENDKWDTGDGGSVTVKLSGLTGNYQANWFNPRTGSETDLGLLPGGSNHALTPPSADDWVLHLSKTSSYGLEYIVDDSSPEFLFQGSWIQLDYPDGHLDNFRYSFPGKGGKIAGWKVNTIVTPGIYEAYVWKVGHYLASEMASTVHYRVIDKHGYSDWIIVDQSTPGLEWVRLGTFEFSNSSLQGILVTNEATSFVIADAVKLVYMGPSD